MDEAPALCYNNRINNRKQRLPAAVRFGVSAVNVVDLRNIFASCTDELIDISGNLVTYVEEKMEEGKPTLFLMEYDRASGQERTLASCEIPAEACVRHCFRFEDAVLAVMESGGSDVWLLRAERSTDEKKTFTKLHFVGDFQGCFALDESHLLFYTGPNERDGKVFRRYAKLTGFHRAAYLYDLEEDKYYCARDPRVCGAGPSRFVPFLRGGVPWLLLLQPRGNEEEKRKCSKEERWLGSEINDEVWECPLHDFLVSLKAGEERLPFDLVLSAGTDGLLRYVGQDDENLYFRAVYFPKDDQRICACCKNTGKKSVAATLNLAPGEAPAKFSIDRFGGRAYRIEEADENFHVTGILHSEADVEYPKELGTFVTCVEDRFLVARYILADDTDSFEFNSVYDALDGSRKSYECRCAVSGDTVVLY